MNLDDPPVDVEPVQTVHPVQTDLPPPSAKNSRKPSPSKPSDRPSNLVLDENYAWRTFKGIVTDNEVNECYNMLVREFERSGIHDLFKVSFARSCVVLCYLFVIIFSNFHSSMNMLCQNSKQQPARLRSLLLRPRQLMTKPRS